MPSFEEKDLHKHDAEKQEDSVSIQSAKSSHAEGVGRDYELKCMLINKCLQEEIGFGRYQYQLFILAGLGWLADNLWLQGLAVVLPQVEQEFNPSQIEYAVLAEFAGLICGATTWGILADVIGRRLSFMITLFLAGVFGLAAGGAPNFVAFCSLIACMGFGIGGNLPVDGALYLEAIPASHQWTLTLLSVWWAIGQLVSSLISWGFIVNYSCDTSIPAGQCPRSENPGWRYTIFTLGSITLLMFISRFFIFDVKESSKYLVSQGRDEEAIEALEHMAKLNGKSITLTLQDFKNISEVDRSRPPMSNLEIVKEAVTSMSLSHIKPLFTSKILGINTSLIIFIWGLIGLAYPLFNAYLPLYLAAQGSSSGSGSLDETYRNYAIISVLGIPGSLIACAVVDWTRGSSGSRFFIGGRKLSLAVSTALTGIFLFLFTTSHNAAAVLGWSCASGLTQNAMYGVLYAYTPEVFPAPHRGTGDALCSALNRIGGFIAPLIKIATTPKNGGLSANAANGPVFVSAALFMVSAFLTVLLPIEAAGRSAL
ncbi:MFS general substrate transporter [Coniophora puteana RWD-64-598 SS2]|uniref:MFS general substrate transporter n=1 Tax=Coniophora puteana (strain RWD-64-598) TaxID=741705 RepID=A0A5M3MXB6_CONPW|nr:MFS general substrate transporter [Coniophora puteana RWD-64-598 SS2]EIW83728.1 MFS general substrate transporter [Coniophora puteana RWD-64-598 SS2]